MLLYRSPHGALSIHERAVVLRVRPDLHVAQRVDLAAYRQGALDDAIAAAFGREAVAEAHAREAAAERSLLFADGTLVPLTEEEIDRVVEGIRAGAEVIVGGSRCHTTYRGRDGELFAEDFDEGQTEERPCSVATLRAVVAGQPETFLGVLRAPLRARFAEALLSGAPNARVAFGELMVFGECLVRADLVEAVLGWPDEPPSPDARAKLARETAGLDVYHAVMSAIGYGSSSPRAGEVGLRFFRAVEEILGELPQHRRYRADFREMTGDTEGAVRDLVWERDRATGDDAAHLTRRIERLEKR